MMSSTWTHQSEPSDRPSLAIASSNRGKIAEFTSLLGDSIRIMSLTDLGLPSPEETGTSFEENAILKARYVYEQRGIVTLADDSGLEVDALDGSPGVLSARYAGDHHNDADNRTLLLRNLNVRPDGVRTARFVAVIAIVDIRGNVSVFRGDCEGTIAHHERGSGGFGYDALFQLGDGRTMAELPAAEKNAVSHRSRALHLAMPVLRAALGQVESYHHHVMP